MKTKQITINFGLVASPSFPAVARARVLAEGAHLAHGYTDYLRLVRQDVLEALEAIGCDVGSFVTVIKGNEPRLVIECKYPWQAEIDACKPPSVLKYGPYMRLYELAAFFAQDCVAVLPNGEQGLLVGAGAAKCGVFDSTKFITLD